ncbi:MAG: Gfo/Idh/MocA family protein [Acidobacteriota bacterium]
MKRLKAGVIGLGVGERHVRAYHNHPDCEVVAICDFDLAKLQSVHQEIPEARAVVDADEILLDPEIDVVSIASFDNYHYDQIVKAIDNNKHLMVEKPLCLYEHEARHIKELLSQKPNLKVSSNLVLRTVPRFKWLKQAVLNNELGQVFYVEGDYNYGRVHKLTEGWRRGIEGYSVFYGGGVHLVDLLIWLTGDDVIEVSSFGNNISTQGTQFKHDDIIVAILKFKSGMVGKVAANFGCVFPHFHCLNIYGTKATFVNDLHDGRLFKSSDSKEPPERIVEEYPGTSKGEVIHSFVDYILTEQPPLVTKEEVFNSMSVCFAVEKSMSGHGSVAVEYI